MNGDEDGILRFGPFELDTAERELRHADGVVPLTPKAFDTLAYLVKNGGHLVTKEELLTAVWPDSFVEEANLARTIHTLRKMLREHAGGETFIQTVPTKGYRFVGPVAAELEMQTHASGDTTDVNLSKSELFAGRMLAAAGILVGAAFLVGISFVGFTSGPKYATSHTSHGEAYRHYQQGKMLTERRLKGDLEEALRSFEKAIELDPQYAAAYAGKANVKSFMFMATNSHNDIVQAREAARKAVELDPNNSLGHTLLCRIQGTYDWDFYGAVRTCERAVELDPGDFEAYRELGFALNVIGAEDRALAAMDRAVELAPNSFNKRSRGVVLYHSRRYEEAIAQLEQVEETDPEYIEATKWIMRAYAMKQDHRSALDRYVKWKIRTGAVQGEIDAINTAFDAGGWHAVLRLMTDPPGPEKPVLKSLVDACNLAQLGENDRAFGVLQKMFERRAIMLVTIGREPALDPLRDDPRFEELLRKIKLK